ncbi:hypothetical protein C8T65DRAFT_587704, partial [Cerioporus squamosus]
PPGHWRFFFRCHAIGTKTKKYDTLTWDCRDYDPSVMPTSAQGFKPDPFDEERIKLAAWRKFRPLLRPLIDGPVCVAARGKELVVAAGYHAVRIHLGLEASVFVVSLEDYHALTERCRPGPNKNKAKAKRLRSFKLPSRFVVPGCPTSKDEDDRYINIFAAVVCQDCAIIITDFARLVRLHVMSLARLWMYEDLTVGCDMWSTLWDNDHGPDWACETADAIEHACAWRCELLANPGTPAAETPIIVSLYAVQTVFNGLGKHTANDFLHLLGVWPGMPTIQLCSDKGLFNRFLQVLVRYMGLWSSDRFLEVVAPPANHPNPFAFNYRSHRDYISKFVHVYRKSFVNVSSEFYNQLVASGLLDPSHTIGMWCHCETFNVSTAALTECSYKVLPVYIYKLGSVKFYSVIRARRPDTWRYALNDQRVTPDMRRLANNTTVGMASFREMVQNVQDVSVPWKAGRKKTVGQLLASWHPLVLTCLSTEQVDLDVHTGTRARRICRSNCR